MSKEVCISKIIIEHYRLHKDLKILNENTNECMICCNNFKDNIVQIRNNLCKCFNTVLLCDKCFINWFLHDNRCFICRKLYLDKNSNNKYEMFHFKNLLILLKLKAITNNKKVIININNDSINNDLTTSNYLDNDNHIIERNIIENNNIYNNNIENINIHDNSVDNLEISNNSPSVSDVADIHNLSRKICMTYIKCLSSIGFIMIIFALIGTFLKNDV